MNGLIVDLNHLKKGENCLINLRWDPYFTRQGEQFSKFWNDYLSNSKKDILFILGLGFDPRMCLGINSIFKYEWEGKRDCILLNFNEGSESPSQKYSDKVNYNSNTLISIINNFKGNLTKKTIAMWSTSGERRRTGSLNASKIFSSIHDLILYSDIIIDISSLPRSIYFPLVAKILSLLDDAKNKDITTKIPNIFIVVAENTEFDKKIQEVGLAEKADYLFGFRGTMQSESTREFPVVWIPILGEGKASQLDKIYSFVNPDEICPILPFPSLNPRRSDELFKEYAELLFDHWLIEHRSIIYTAEKNPFQVYRRICFAVVRYNEALKPLQGCKVVISAISSKLLSLGALLAAYDLKMQNYIIGIAHIDTLGYEITNPLTTKDESELHMFWLTGGIR